MHPLLQSCLKKIILNKLLGALWLALLLLKQMQLLASNGSTATGSFGSHGPGSSDDNRNTRRRLDTFSSPEDEHARSAVLLRFPCEQYHTGITNWINNLWENQIFQPKSKPVRIHCKAGSVSARLVFETRAKYQDFVARHKDDGITNEIDSPFCNAKTVISVRQSKSLKIGRSESNLRLCGRFWPNSSKFSSLMEMTKVPFIVLALDARSQVLSIKDRRNVDRYTSHETFSRHFHPCAHITLWLMVSHDVFAQNMYIHMSPRV